MVELHRAGQTLTDLSRQFGPTPWAISRWVKQADRDEGGDGGLTTAEREELTRLRRENKRLQIERGSSQKLQPGSPRRPFRIRGGLHVVAQEFLDRLVKGVEVGEPLVALLVPVYFSVPGRLLLGLDEGVEFSPVVFRHTTTPRVPWKYTGWEVVLDGLLEAESC